MHEGKNLNISQLSACFEPGIDMSACKMKTSLYGLKGRKCTKEGFLNFKVLTERIKLLKDGIIFNNATTNNVRNGKNEAKSSFDII